MSDVALRPNIPAMSQEGLARARAMADAMRALPAEQQRNMKVTHDLWAGVYARTLEIPKGEVAAGVFLKIPMLFILAGEALVYVGTEAPLHLVGYKVLRAEANRMQIVHAIEQTFITAVFGTEAKTREEAEREATDEIHLLAPPLIEGP